MAKLTWTEQKSLQSKVVIGLLITFDKWDLIDKKDQKKIRQLILKALKKAMS
jgi:hypothetical protein